MNGVEIVVGYDIKDRIVNVRRNGDKILSIKLTLEKELVHVNSSYAPQVGLYEKTKKQFWNLLDELIHKISPTDKVFVDGNLNGHAEKMRYDRIHKDRILGLE